MTDSLEATVTVGGNSYACRCQLKRWKEGVGGLSGAGHETFPGLPNWSGILYPPQNEGTACLRNILEEAHMAEDEMLRINGQEAPFSVDESANPDSGKLEIHGRGGFTPVRSA